MKLALGTAQFGNKYGITNSSGILVQKQANKILDVARENSVEFLDTAPSYGRSEKIIGRSIQATDKFKIISKTIKFEDEQISKSEIKKLEENFFLSLERMKQESIYAILVHRPSDLKKKGGEKIFEKLIEFKNKNLVKKIGISTDNKNDLEFLVETFSIDIVQIPINIFNQTFINGKVLAGLKKKKIEIHARSIFFQGILLHKSKKKNQVFDFFDPYLSKLKNELKNRKINILDCALKFVDQNESVDVGIVGVLNDKQLIEIIKIHKKKIPKIDFLDDFRINSQYVNPSLWNNLLVK